MNQGTGLVLSDTLASVEDAGLFISLCTIKNPPATTSTLGQVNLDPAAFIAVTGLIDLECMASPLEQGTPRELEYKAAQEIDQTTHFHVLLNGYYPAILQKQQAEIDGVPYDIMTVESDSQHTMTRLVVRAYDL